MLFDKLAGFIEKNTPEFVKRFQAAALFDFPYRAHDAVKPGTFTTEDLEEFFLPFPAVAIEDRATCTVLFDTQDNQIGLENSPRLFVDITPMKAKDPEAFVHKSKFGSMLDKSVIPDNLFQSAFGKIHSLVLGDKGNYQVEGQVDSLVLFDDRGTVLLEVSAAQDKDDPFAAMAFEETKAGVLGNVVTSIEELMLANRNKQLFVLEHSPLKPKPIKKGRIARSHDRPNYVMVTPDAIRKIMGVTGPSPSSGSREGHDRRRHWRTLRSDRFVHRQGERILIDAMWVGPSDAVVGNRRYKVRLDI
jgi:hypothetical protein